MRLDQALVARGLCASRTEAQELIEKGLVLVNGIVTYKQTKNIHEGDGVEVTGGRPFVSRGGEKLEGALVHTGLIVEHMTALDVGSSTGGFTDCLLKHGAKKVVAVDVGTDQLHASLRNIPQVELHEKTDIRNFITEDVFDMIVGDVSFISLHHIIPELVRLSKVGTIILFLIKPQFEVGKGSTKKGIVRDESVYEDVLSGIEKTFIEHGFDAKDIFPSPIIGGDGNKEFFIYAVRT